MAGIYVHIPFCRQACTYCDFYFTTNLSGRSAFVEAVISEAHLRKATFPHSGFATLYYGGGTPSLLSGDELVKLTTNLRDIFAPSPDAEFTVECNPDDMDAAKLQTLQQLGVNRLSLGIQSFSDRDLTLMNRSHNAASAQAAIRAAQDAGFTNLTVDLIYGIPGMSPAEWEDNIGRVIDSGVPHVSAYSLTVEERTQLSHQVKKGEVKMPPDEAAFAQYETLIQMLNAAGIEQYELSNFAKPGFRSRHNGAYWQAVPYLGLGPSAHSFDGASRSWNIPNHTLYAKMLAAGTLPVKETETLSLQTRLNEYLMTHLRILAGISPQYMRDHFSFDIEKEEGEALSGFIRNGWMKQSTAGNYYLTTRGLFVSDSIISDLFQVSG